MSSSPDSIHQKLSFTRENRHQYLETAMVSASDAEREMMQAEARGRERKIREALLKRKVQNAMLGVAAFLGLSMVVGLAFWMSR